MIRRIYRTLIALHPRTFRERFGEEMLAIFDETDASPAAARRLLTDATFSLARQWLLRPEFREPEIRVIEGGSMFATLAPWRMRSEAWVCGGALSVALIFGVIFLIDHPGKTPRWLIGMHRAADGLFTIARSSLADAKPNTLVQSPPEQVNPWKAIGGTYFDHMPVLHALDTDNDYVISSREMIFSPGPLRDLDRNNDGKLSPEECGFFFGRIPAPPKPEVVAGARNTFMHFHPVLAILDSDRNDEISATEISFSPITLRKLDVNHDGFVTPDELMPH